MKKRFITGLLAAGITALVGCQSNDVNQSSATTSAVQSTSSNLVGVDLNRLDRENTRRFKRAQTAFKKGQYQTVKSQLKPIVNAANDIRDRQQGLVVESSRLLGDVYAAQGQFDKAEQLYRQALYLSKKAYGDQNLIVANVASKLAHFYLLQNKLSRADRLYGQAIDISKAHFKANSLKMAETYSQIGDAYFFQDHLEKAEVFYRQALHVYETVMRNLPDDLLANVNQLNELLSKQSRGLEIDKLFQNILSQLRSQSAKLSQTMIKLNSAYQKKSQLNSQENQDNREAV